MSGKVIPVRVALRARPLIPREMNEGCQTCLWYNSDEPQVILGKDKAFTFDYVFSPNDNQQDVYEKAAQKLVKSTFKGYNATVLAYGQTGSGKTYSMGGCYEASLNQDEEAMGIIPRILRDLFNGITERTDYTFKVTVSYLEIYNEDLLDLLCLPSQRQPLSIREELNGEIKIKGLREVVVGSLEDTLQCLSQGARSRTTGATAMNDTSSRSHAIFTIYIEKSKKEDMNDHCIAKFHLVDLAGSERAKKTRAEGDRFKEGVNINRGLLALGNVISALGEDVQKRGHIPYRDSKLTRLLQDSLGGNSHTLMVACVSPADSNMEETLNTLRYADRARKIKNKPVINRDPQSDEIMRLRQVVESLQMQLLSRGGGVGDTISESSVVSSASAESMQEVSRLTERNQMLEKEVTELTQELERAIDQNTRMCQTVMQLEMARDRLKAKLRSLKQNTGVDFELLSSSVDVDSNPQMKEELEKLRKLTENVKESDDDENTAVLPETPHSRAKSTEHVLRQAKMSRELQELNQILAKKQELANQMNRSQEEMSSIRAHYEAMMKEWENKVNQLQKEKEELSATLHDTRSIANASKVSEQRRKRLQELEHEMSTLKRKMTEQSKAVKLKEQSDKHVSRLNTEIVALKQQRVRLMKQMKEESDHWRKWKQQKDKEVMQLMQKDRKRQAELAKLQQTNQKQQSVLKRKVEEAAAANRRLKEALARQKAVLNERSAKMETCDSTSIGNRVRKWLSHELDVRVSLREARYHMTSLMADRKELKQQQRELQEKLDGPFCKIFTWMDDSGTRSEKSFEKEELKRDMEELTTQIELRNIQIQDLQQKICDADQESKGKSMWESIHTMMEAKCALKWLLEQAVDGKADRSALQGEIRTAKEASDANREAEQRMEQELARLRKTHEEELLQLGKEHQQKTLFLLGMEKNKQSEGKAGDEVLRKKLKIQSEELGKLASVAEDLEKKTAECEELKRKMTGLMMYDGKLALMPSIDDPNGSPFLTPRPKPQMKAKGSKKLPALALPPETPGGLTDLETDEDWDVDDEESDPNWQQTPLFSRRPVKRSSSSQCQCKGDCKNKRCSCSKNERQCGSDCGCDPEVCLNRQLDSTVTTSSSSMLNSTFNVESPDNTTTTTKKPSGKVLLAVENKKATGTSRTRQTDKQRPEAANSSDDGEKPATQRGKRSGEMAFKEPEEGRGASKEAPKRKRTMYSSSSNSSYFGPLS
ncbi:chromosome-associated kinesin KIF4A-like isoform X3 [Babylonia areolata]|uniref:chromosome-associated kinesin KIF4A-like isoform X3 n=1 Tax=Babylonia areolata TaxID=304850 RepID=UPI003FD3130B